MPSVFLQVGLILSSILSQVYSSDQCTLFRKCLVLETVPAELTVCRDEEITNKFAAIPGNYSFLNYQWNLLVKQITPIGYFLPATTVQIQVAVKCARALQLRVIPKSGGHGYAKYAFGDSQALIIDLQKMTLLSLDPENKTVEIGPGYLSGPLAVSLYTKGQLMLPNGLCPMVGISYSLGGGYSFLSRRYGLVMDSIMELDLVTSRGILLTSNKTSNDDLFWALRGAGSGSFGIVTRYKFKLNPVPSFVIYGRKTYKLSVFPAVFDAFQTWAASEPPRSINCVMTASKDEILVEVIQVLESENRRPNTDTMSTFFGGNPFPKSVSNGTEIVVLNFLDYLQKVGAYGSSKGGIETATRHDYAAIYFHGTSFFVSKVIDAEGVATVNGVIQEIPEYISMEFQMNGGAINDVEPHATAYVHRGLNIFKVNADYLGPSNRTKNQEIKALKWQQNFLRISQAEMQHTESYQNNVDPDLENYLERYYGENLERLIEVKNKYDPEDYFQNPQSIPTGSKKILA